MHDLSYNTLETVEVPVPASHPEIIPLPVFSRLDLYEVMSEIPSHSLGFYSEYHANAVRYIGVIFSIILMIKKSTYIHPKLTEF